MEDYDRKCYICDETIERSFENIYLNYTYTEHSRILLCEMLETIFTRPLIKSEKPEMNIGCASCINKINKYDFGITIAKQMQKEIRKILEKTELKYRSNSNPDEEEEQLETNNIPCTFYILKNEAKEEILSDTEYIENFLEDNEQGNDVENYVCKSGDEEQEAADRFQFINIPNIDIVEVDSKPHKIKEKQPRLTNFCRECNIQFSSKVEYRAHRKKIHSAPRPVGQQSYVCDICGANFCSQSRLKTHIRIHDDTNPFKCDICGKHFTQRGALKRHQPIHTGERPYQCEKCGKQFIHYSSFHMHNLAHDDIREKECTICGLKLRSNSHLNRHMRVHTGAKPHECPKCGQKFAQRYNMNVHLRSHDGINRKRTTYKCEICKEKFTKLFLLNEHKCVYHDVVKEKSESILTKIDKDLYKCEICQELFQKLNLLTDHNNIYHNIETNIIYENVLQNAIVE